MFLPCYNIITAPKFKKGGSHELFLEWSASLEDIPKSTFCHFVLPLCPTYWRRDCKKTFPHISARHQEGSHVRALISTVVRLLDSRKTLEVRKVGFLHPLMWNGILRGWKERGKEWKGLHRIKKLRPDTPRTVGRQVLQQLEVKWRDEGSCTELAVDMEKNINCNRSGQERGKVWQWRRKRFCWRH